MVSPGKKRAGIRFGATLQKLRKAAGKTQAELASAVGILPNNLSKLESGGQGVPRRARVLDLLAALDITDYGMPDVQELLEHAGLISRSGKVKGTSGFPSGVSRDALLLPRGVQVSGRVSALRTKVRALKSSNLQTMELINELEAQINELEAFSVELRNELDEQVDAFEA